MVTLNDIVDCVYVITTVNSNRISYITDHLNNRGINYELFVSPINTLYTQTTQINQSELSLISAHLSILETAILKKYNKIAILEDDIYLTKSYNIDFNNFIKYIPKNADMCNCSWSSYIHNLNKIHYNDFVAKIFTNKWYGGIFLIFFNIYTIILYKYFILNMINSNTRKPIDWITDEMYSSINCYVPLKNFAYSLSKPTLKDKLIGFKRLINETSIEFDSLIQT